MAIFILVFSSHFSQDKLAPETLSDVHQSFLFSF